MEAGVPAKRPQFITVLCILTWIGCGIGLIASVMGYFAVQTAGAMMDVASASDPDAMTNMSAMPGMEETMNAMKYAGISLAVGVLGILLCFAGSMMMWKLKKTGYYIYVAGQIIPLVVSAILLGATAFGGIALVLGAIIPVVFIILYGVNLKYMS
ncbi:MAG: hypothetical protein JWO44_1471 [Bacteroidetes bacterium]|nr:hypothetical protein [Bacteroidota bacterium]